MQGYIKLYRKTMCSPIWNDLYYIKLWMYCLMKASHKSHQHFIGNQIVILNPGEFITGRSALAGDLNKGMKTSQKLSEISWWRYLTNLEKWGMLNIKKTNKYSVVSIINWTEYQEMDQQLNNRRTSDEQEMVTNNNDKNEKNEKKNKYAEYVRLSVVEYEKLLDEFGEPGTADRIEKLNLYKGSTGKKYKSDYLTILSWEKKSQLLQAKNINWEDL